MIVKNSTSQPQDLNQIEQSIAKIILPELDAGRKNFDKPHTIAVVFWMKKILNSHESQSLNPKIMIVSAYAHDWGYAGLFKNTNSDSVTEINKQKTNHMEIGAEKIKNLLTTKFSKDFSKEEIYEISHLVSIHDKVEELKTEAEITLMEADTLGMLDVSKLKPTFTKKDNQVFLESQIENRRFKFFCHKNFLNIGEKLIKQREAFYG